MSKTEKISKLCRQKIRGNQKIADSHAPEFAVAIGMLQIVFQKHQRPLGSPQV